MLAFRVVDGHFDGAAAQVDDHVIGRTRSRTAIVVVVVIAAAVAAASIPRKVDRARTDPSPHLAPRTVRGSAAVDNSLLDAEPSFPALRFRLGRTWRMRGRRFPLQFSRGHFVSKERTQLLDAVRRMRRTPVETKRRNGTRLIFTKSDVC